LRAAVGDTHSVSPDAFIALLRGPAAHETFGVEEVERNADLPRLLFIRVGAGWERAPAEKRRAVAEASLKAAE
jgi:hypothetical protein